MTAPTRSETVARVCFALSNGIPLHPMIPAGAGAAALPAALTHDPGIYVIHNHSYAPENRYMGITNDFRNRFAGRQGACFELGIRQGALMNVDAYIGRVWYRNVVGFGAGVWNAVALGAYGAVPNMVLDNHNVDFEHLFIKSAQNAFGGHITNTNKVGALHNPSAYPINVRITWNNVALAGLAGGNPPGWAGAHRVAVKIAAHGNLV